ncbi:MAG: glutathione peroxidase [Flavobacterium sp.]|jgi:glutathione peroxidase
MFAKIDVNGKGASPLFQWLKSEKQDEDGNEEIAWNFAKFLVNKEGKVVKRFHPKTPPEDIADMLEALL